MACFGAGDAGFMLGVSGRVGREFLELLQENPEFKARIINGGGEGQSDAARIKRTRAEMMNMMDVREQNGQNAPPEVRYASKPVYEAPRKPLPAPPLWSPSVSVSVPMRTSCVPEPLRIGARG